MESQSLACQRSLIQAEYIQKTPTIQRQAIHGLLALQSSFCRDTAIMQLLFSCVKALSSSMQKRIFPFFPYCFISSGNFPFQLVPGECHSALKPRHTSAHRTNETPKQGDRQIAKWYLFSMALWLCWSLLLPFWIMWSVPKEPLEDWEGSELFLDKGRKFRTTQMH